jgi:hypothetical protein
MLPINLVPYIFVSMLNFRSWKKKIGKAFKARPKESKILESSEKYDSEVLADLPLLKAVQKKTRKNAWKENQERKSVTEYAAASAIITATFSGETKSTESNSDLYHSSFSSDEISGKSKHYKMREDCLGESQDRKNEKYKASDNARIEPKSLPAYSISGSMLYNNIETGKINANSTIASHKLTSPLKPSGLPPNAVMASTLFRTMKLDGKDQNLKAPSQTKHLIKQTPIDVYDKFSTDPPEDEKEAYIHINQTSSKDGSQSCVSSVTMYSSYQNDPLVRASNSLLDILCSSGFRAFDTCEQSNVPLHEA